MAPRGNSGVVTNTPMDDSLTYSIGNPPVYPVVAQDEDVDVKVVNAPELTDVGVVHMPTMVPPPPEVQVKVSVERAAPMRGRLYMFALLGLLFLSLFMIAVTFVLYWYSVNSFLLLLAFIVTIVVTITIGATLLYYRTMRSFVFSSVMTASLFVLGLTFGTVPGVVVYKQASESFGTLFGTLPGVAQVFLVFFFPTSFAIVCALWALYFLETRHKRCLNRTMCNNVALKVMETTGKEIPPLPVPTMERQHQEGMVKGEPAPILSRGKKRRKKRRR